MKTFEEKKQDIIDRIELGEEYCYDIKEGMSQIDIDIKLNSVSVRLGNAIRGLKELQTPKPPTCSTCKHMQKQIYLQECMNEESAIYMDSVDNEYIKSMGCNHHSDFSEV